MRMITCIILHRTLGKSHVLSGKLSILRANVRDFPNKLVLDAKFTSFWWFFIICWLSILYISRYIFTPSISVVLSRHLSCFTLSSQLFYLVISVFWSYKTTIFLLSTHCFHQEQLQKWGFRCGSCSLASQCLLYKRSSLWSCFVREFDKLRVKWQKKAFCRKWQKARYCVDDELSKSCVSRRRSLHQWRRARGRMQLWSSPWL